MKNLRKWSLALAATVLVAGAATLGAQSTGWLSLFIEDSSATVQARGLGRYGAPILIGYGSAVPTLANSGVGPMDGEFFVVRASGSTPDAQVYSASDGAWLTLANIDLAQTWTAVPVFGAGVSLGNDEDDSVTVNGPAIFKVQRLDFDLGFSYSLPAANDDSTVDVADTSTNWIHFPGQQVGSLFFRYEQAFGGTYTPGTFIDTSIDTTSTEGNVFKISDPTIVDANDNDGVEFSVGGDPAIVQFFDEDSTLDNYCEISMRIDDISDLSADDLYFGAFIKGAITDAFNPNGADTYAMFIVSDNAGDLDIETELNGGGTLNDDTGTTWADDATHVLKVVMSADSVSFYVDGTAVTQTNAVLDADNGDEFACLIGYRSSGTDAGVELNYIEVGQEQ